MYNRNVVKLVHSPYRTVKEGDWVMYWYDPCLREYFGNLPCPVFMQVSYVHPAGRWVGIVSINGCHYMIDKVAICQNRVVLLNQEQLKSVMSILRINRDARSRMLAIIKDNQGQVRDGIDFKALDMCLWEELGVNCRTKTLGRKKLCALASLLWTGTTVADRLFHCSRYVS